MLDDILIYHLSDGGGREWYELVVNAGNREKIVGWLERHGVQAPEVGFSDETTGTAMIAVQGPGAIACVESVGAFSFPLSPLKYYSAAPTTYRGAPALVSRTGYTGEDGVELIVAADAALALWESLIAAGGRAVGLGARDTLRLEAAMPLYGHELNERLDPFTADLAFAVDLEGRTFVGSQALASRRAEPAPTRRVGIELTGKRVPREGYGLFAGETSVGSVTSGTFSPTLQRPIAMAYVDAAYAAPGTELTVDIRGSREPARTVRLPFYRRKTTS